MHVRHAKIFTWFLILASFSKENNANALLKFLRHLCALDIKVQQIKQLNCASTCDLFAPIILTFEDGTVILNSNAHL